MSNNDFYNELLIKIKDEPFILIESTFSDGKIIKKQLDLNSSSKKTENFSFKIEDKNYSLLETVKQKERLIIFGGGHIAFPLVKIGKELGFEILVYDDRPKFASQNRFPEASVICDSFENIKNNIKLHPNDIVVIVTRGHAHDKECLEWVLQFDLPKYLGMIGSKRRVAIVKDLLIKDGFSKDKLDKLHSPIGLNISSITPAEIAVSIFAEIIQTLRENSDKHNVFETFDQEILSELANKDSKYKVLITVVYAEGSTPRTKGAKMLMADDGAILGSIGGGCSESKILDDSRYVLRNGGYKLVEIDLTDQAEEDGMVCGGSMKVLIEKIN